MAAAIRQSILITSVALLIFAPVPLPAQVPERGAFPHDADVQPLFAHQGTLALTIEGPLETLMRERSEEEQLPGKVSYLDADGTRHVLDVKLRTRGIYRRDKEHCDFAPIRLNFRKSQVDGTEFAGQDKLKLVTHCQSRDSYEQYVLKEYLAYRIFSVLTDYSFGARLLHVTYVDTENDREAESRYAFVIEDNDMVAERIAGGKVEVRMANYELIEDSQAGLVVVFEYLIGNTDFSMVHPDKGKDCCHNIELFSQTPGRYIAIPYDFDFSGIVDARYAEPHPSLRIRSVTRREYRGVCEHNHAVEGALSLFRAHEAEIRKLPQTIEGMQDGVREDATRYIEDFYEDIRDAEAIEDNLLTECRSAD